MKSGQQLEKWSRHRTNENTIQCLAYAQMILGVLSMNLWRVMGRMLADREAETSGGDPHRHDRGEGSGPPTVGPIKAMESLVPLLVKVFAGEMAGGKLAAELARLARYAAQEKRARPSLDAFVISLLT